MGVAGSTQWYGFVFIGRAHRCFSLFLVLGDGGEWTSGRSCHGCENETKVIKSLSSNNMHPRLILFLKVNAIICATLWGTQCRKTLKKKMLGLGGSPTITI